MFDDTIKEYNILHGQALVKSCLFQLAKKELEEFGLTGEYEDVEYLHFTTQTFLYIKYTNAWKE